MEKKKLLEDEGIVNVFQRESVKQKSKETMIIRYGKEHPMFIDEFVNKVIQTKKDNDSFGVFKGSVSALHLLVCDWLNEINVKHQKEFHLYKFNNKGEKIGWYSYDILITGANKIIEINGDYWHANPKFYKVSDYKKNT